MQPFSPRAAALEAFPSKITTPSACPGRCHRAPRRWPLARGRTVRCSPICRCCWWRAGPSDPPAPSPGLPQRLGPQSITGRKPQRRPGSSALPAGLRHPWRSMVFSRRGVLPRRRRSPRAPGDHRDNLARLNLMLPGFTAGLNAASPPARRLSLASPGTVCPWWGRVPQPEAGREATASRIWNCSRASGAPRLRRPAASSGRPSWPNCWPAGSTATSPLKPDLANAVAPGRFLLREQARPPGKPRANSG